MIQGTGGNNPGGWYHGIPFPLCCISLKSLLSTIAILSSISSLFAFSTLPYLECVAFCFVFWSNHLKYVRPSANTIRGEDVGGTYHVAYRIREAHRSEARAAIRM